MKTLKVSEVVFREDLYPRIETSATTVQKYAEDLDVLPPIEVNQRNELIDGWHRWTAHRKMEAETIKIKVTPTESDAELLELAIARNATHGLQLSQDDKRDMARKIYGMTPEKEREGKKADLCRILSVSRSVVFDWLSRMDKDAKEARNKRIFEAWLACRTQEEIAEQENVTQQAVGAILQKNPESDFLVKSDKAASEHAVDFDIPLYNVWKQQTKTAGSSHFGNSEVRWLDNLLYLYTKPFDVVVDPFAGGGSTIDLCRKRFRRYWVSDRNPIVEREKEIRIHDVGDGLPKAPWKDVKLVYLDPPYWWQAKGQYSNDNEDMANMSLEDFTKILAATITDFSKKLTDAYIALIIQPTQWNSPERQFTDHIGDMLRSIKLPVDMRFSVPYESQQCNAQMVEWAKANKKCLVLTREIIVWKKSMTRAAGDGRDEPFNDWIRNCADLDSVRYSLSVQNPDLWIHRFFARKERKSNDTVIDHIALIEVKSFGAEQNFSQRDTFDVIDEILRSASVRGGRRRPIKIKDRRHTGAWRYVRWLGTHLLVLSGNRPDNSESITWDGKPISLSVLIELLRFDRDMDHPSKSMDTRRHHRRPRREEHPKLW